MPSSWPVLHTYKFTLQGRTTNMSAWHAHTSQQYRLCMSIHDHMGGLCTPSQQHQLALLLIP